jgi:hypothetical protein
MEASSSKPRPSASIPSCTELEFSWQTRMKVIYVAWNIGRV